MNPILASALFGLTKGLLKGPDSGPPLGFGQVVVAGPIMEELVYRVAPKMMGVPGAVSAFGFAVDHVVAEKRGPDLGRLADVFAGGLLYESAYKQFGLLGAIAAHASHNLAILLVKSAGRPAPTVHQRRATKRRKR